MGQIRFRDLRADEMECRVSTASEKGCSLLIYKTARTDANILDETVGPENWQCKFYEAGGILFCSLGINVTGCAGSLEMKDGQINRYDPMWVWKDDSGSAGNIEAEKSTASDCFKRAGFKWGIGRPLYTAPFIWVPAELCNIRTGRNGKPTCYDHFRVEKVRIDGGFITGLSIWNDSKKCRAFTYVDDSRHVEN